MIPNTFGFFDKYSRQARVYPALFTILPLVMLGASVFYSSSITPPPLYLALLGPFGALYFMSTLARSLGKRTEERLLKKWGELPSTLLLRHDSRLDPYTRQRYISFLENNINGLNFPSAKQERDNSQHSNRVYRSAINWLKERTRGVEFSLLLKENIDYGFRRNLRGLKPIGIGSNLLGIGLILTLLYRDHGGAIWQLERWAELNPLIVFSLLLSLLAIVAWLFIINDRWVEEAAWCYAERLLSACDTLPHTIK